MATLKTTLRSTGIYAGLAIVTLEGFDPGPGGENGPVGRPGSANWFVEQYGVQGDEFDPKERGVLWEDYDFNGWTFSVLIDAAEVDSITSLAEESKYDVARVEEVSEPCVYGDSHSGTVTILKHPDGWVIL